MNTGWTRRPRAGAAWPITVATLVGVAVGIALPRPFAVARPAHQPAAPPLAFQEAQRPPTGGDGPPGRAATGAGSTQPGAPVATRRFEAPAAMAVNFVLADSATRFEQLAGRLVESLAASDDPRRRAQAAGWAMYRVREPGPNNNVAYVWLLDPAVAGANYAVPQLLNEMFPEDVQQLYEQYNASFGVGQTWLNLDPVALADEPR